MIRCFWEHNGNDTLLYAIDYIGAYTRGATKEIAAAKMPKEIRSYCRWCGRDLPTEMDILIVEEKESDLQICDADSDAIFAEEKKAIGSEEYEALKALALRSAEDFLTLYHSIPDKTTAVSPSRKTFYGEIPRTAEEMYKHTKSVNAYYFGEIDIQTENEGDIYACRKRAFERLEATAGFLANNIFDGSYGEEWSLRKLMRRFIWHDRIHAKAMWRLGCKLFGEECVSDPFCFQEE